MHYKKVPGVICTVISNLIQNRLPINMISTTQITVTLILQKLGFDSSLIVIVLLFI